MRRGDNKRLTLTIDPDLLDWIDDKVRERIFLNRSDAIFHLLKKLKKEHENQNHHYFG